MRLLAAAMLLLASAAIAQDALPPATPLAAPATPAPAVTVPARPVPATVSVVLTTAAGTITLSLEKERAPITTANFLHYVDTHRLDGATLYRAVKVQPGYGLVQGGLQNDPRKVYPPIKLEPTSQTGLSHTDGTISMARAAPDSATADFFIVVGDIPSMDADPTKSGDNLGFAAFGHVTAGMDVVRAALDAPTSPTAGPPGMQGQILVRPIRIVSARRAP